jgi:protein arginine N-methyltransferase 3
VFAARGGAKQVFAIEASGLATKARENIRNNGLEGVITSVHESSPRLKGRELTMRVIQGKVENIQLPVKHVDVIISEWMVSRGR